MKPRSKVRQRNAGAGNAANDARHASGEERKAVLISLWEAGLTTQQIADEMGTTEPAVRALAYRTRKQGWPLPRRRFRVGGSSHPTKENP